MPKESHHQSRDGLHKRNDYGRDIDGRHAFWELKGWQTKEGMFWVGEI